MKEALYHELCWSVSLLSIVAGILPSESSGFVGSLNDMSLTPVYVRGKRKSASSTVPMLAMDNPLNPKKMKRSLASVRANRSTRGRPTLQSLPVELLESIFLYSANLALPRASHLIGAKLSGKATLLRLFMAVFHETWDQWFGIPRLQLQGPKLNDEIFFVYEGDASFQVSLEIHFPRKARLPLFPWLC